MNYYRLTDYSSIPLEREIIPPTWDGSRVERCFIDNDALENLNKLVTGPICSPEEIKKAEIALRAFIFHDKVSCVTPGIRKYQQCDLNSDPFQILQTLEISDSYPGIKDVLENAEFHIRAWTIEHLYTFSNKQVEKQYLDAHNTRRENKLKAYKAKELKKDHIKPYFWLDMELAKFKKVGTSDKDYYENIFKQNEELVSRFLKPLPRTGLANYFANPLYRKHQDKFSKMNANMFFETLDKSWEKHREIIDYQLGIPVYPFIAIVLNRANHRFEIPKEIILLREEFQKARNQLWGLFDDIQLRNKNLSVTKRMLGDIEKETSQIIPKAFSQGENWFPIHFKFLGQFISLMNSEPNAEEIAESFNKIETSTLWPFHMIDIAKVTTKQLREIDWNTLCSKHFSDSEMKTLENWRWK